MIACVALETGPEAREHVWIEVTKATESSLAGRTLPDSGSAARAAGISVEFEDLESLVDWYSPDEQTTPRGAP